MLTDFELIEKIKKEKDSDALVEISTRHTGAYFNVIHRYANAYPNVVKLNDLQDDKLFNIYQFVLDYKPEKGTKLSSYIYTRTNYLCKNLLTKDKTCPTSGALQLGKPDSDSFYNSDGMKGENIQVEISDDLSQDSQVKEKIDSNAMTEDILSLINKWCPDKRANDIIKFRHLNVEGRPKTWRQIGKIFKISHERARQIYLENIKIVKDHVCD